MVSSTPRPHFTPGKDPVPILREAEVTFRFISKLKENTVRKSVRVCLFFSKIVCFWYDSPHWARVSSFTRFLDHKQRRATVGRTPLDE